MKKISLQIIAIFALSLPMISWGHGNDDPIHELGKKNLTIEYQQANFESLNEKSQQLDNLEKRLEAINSKILILRNLMAADFPHINENMSKYKIDYIEQVDVSLVQLRRMMEQYEQVARF